MLRRQTRLRREYIYRKTIEQRQKTIEDKKNRLKQAIDENRKIPTDLRDEALKLQQQTDWDDAGGEGIISAEDDEYRWAGVEDPKVIISTSHDPSSKLKQFSKELNRLIPNSQRINRGNYNTRQIVEACRSNQVTDLILVQETRGVPDVIQISHFPYGPTAAFTLSNVVMRHDVPDVGPMSEQYPHLIFSNMTSKLGQRTMNVLKYLFPVPKDDSHRTITFVNQDDYISFRHHVYKKNEGQIELTEIGPRFEMKLYQIKLGTIDQLDACDTEWQYRPFMNTTKKRQFLANENDKE
ncbi:unnamed protein product [Rotaria magnacalcarata]|uniref:Brix domain-containing protein n=4 Tax=Rotaria magnacalcarata TaxID=392030 RepID=A0A815QFD0_9BILA|nr:unnamed protein product [Rotaria magnacalcarata]CAF1662361.1 unnamed protein product [Rotaria magnacalcarata]CAF1923082.1 unnamed protein product [Rotaria magnacalcarata]CAF2035966.1 unnamed protein product [Rotaria magnacalcarata]CAF2244986.1 unnamed protein product [Rotaria magnacalcarata]